MAKATNTEMKARESTFDTIYSMVLNGDTTTTINTPCTFSNMIIPPIKNNPRTEGSEKTTNGSAIDNTFSGKNDRIIRYMIVITT
jgi:hypothetical protein